jgi:hypothetical protein
MIGTACLVVRATGFVVKGEIMIDELKKELAELDRELADYLKRREKERAKLVAELNEGFRLAHNQAELSRDRPKFRS